MKELSENPALVAPANDVTPIADVTVDCGERALVVAYLDGELDSAEAERFETHLKICSACAFDLSEQRRVLCALSFALTRAPGDALPADFAARVVARAQTDMRGVRASGERGRALLICSVLSAAGLLLIGAAAHSVMLPAVGGVRHLLLSVLRLIYHPLEGLGTAVLVVLRAVGREILSLSNTPHSIPLLIFAVAVALLPLLILRYHRTETAG
ncbi:MAG TPA: anti-sigma factor [Pyrinomonadaceae bacterium]|nr:anti-sigma factor [Pyrinomonadaceae bacterium]